MYEKMRGSEIVFSGRLVNVRVDKVELEDGRQSVREVVEHPGAVGILPVTADGDLILVRQFRYAIGREILEIPAGTREEGESAEACARRELVEETGYSAARLEHLVSFFVSPGWCTEELVIYRASDLAPGDVHTDMDEVIAVQAVRPEQIPGLMHDGQIADAKTITALLLHLTQ